MFYESVFWGIFVCEAFQEHPLDPWKAFLKWIWNKIISFSYCKVKLLNDIVIIKFITIIIIIIIIIIMIIKSSTSQARSQDLTGGMQ